MKKYLLAALIALLPTFAQAWDTKALNETIDQTNFSVNDHCSGTLIDSTERLVLTAQHCVDDQYEIVEEEIFEDSGEVKKKKVRKFKPGTVSQITFDGHRPTKKVEYRTVLKGYDTKKDLALLQIVSDIPNTKAATIACDNPTRGDKAYIVGNPKGLYSSLTTGVVSSIQRSYESIGMGDGSFEALIQVSGGIVAGNSGGAVYNEQGRLIGVPVLGHRTNEVIAFMVPISEVLAFLKGKATVECQ